MESNHLHHVAPYFNKYISSIIPLARTTSSYPYYSTKAYEYTIILVVDRLLGHPVVCNTQITNI